MQVNLKTGQHIITDVFFTVVCVPPCVHGACVATNSCNCDADYRGDACDTLIEARGKLSH